MDDQKDKMVRPETVAGRLDVSERTVRNMCVRGDLPAIKSGRQWRIYSDWEEQLRERTRRYRERRFAA